MQVIHCGARPPRKPPAFPFGFDEASWGEVTDRVGVLRDHLEDPDASDDDIVEAATELRTYLRPMV